MTDSAPCHIDCLICSESKTTKSPSNGNLINNKPEHTIYIDLVGPFRYTSNGGSKYMLNMIVGKLRYGHVVTRQHQPIEDGMLKFINWIEQKSSVKFKSYIQMEPKNSWHANRDLAK